MRQTLLFLPLAAIAMVICSCAGGYSSGGYGSANMGGPSAEERQTKIATERTGNFYYGRRYYVEKTRFWGYLRKPGQSANSGRLVIFNESRRRAPDRLSETAPPSQRYGFDSNYEYRIEGHFTGETVYEVNSNQFLPEFMLTGYQVVDKQPGWLFSPKDHYNARSITLVPQ